MKISAKNVLVCVVVIVVLVAFFLLMYRTNGYIAATRSYRCVESTIGDIDSVNMLFDVEDGILAADAEMIAADAQEAKDSIENRTGCSADSMSLGVGDLTDKQHMVDETGVVYLDLVMDAAGKVVDGEDTWDDVDAISDAYEAFLSSIALYESELDSAEAKFFLISG